MISGRAGRDLRHQPLWRQPDLLHCPNLWSYTSVITTKHAVLSEAGLLFSHMIPHHYTTHVFSCTSCRWHNWATDRGRHDFPWATRKDQFRPVEETSAPDEEAHAPLTRWHRQIQLRQWVSCLEIINSLREKQFSLWWLVLTEIMYSIWHAITGKDA